MYGSKMCIDKDTYTHLIILIMKFLEEENFKESLQAYGDVSILVPYIFRIPICRNCSVVWFIDWSFWCRLEQESKIFFNMHHFGEIVMNGEWEKAEKYLSAFTKLDDSNHSKKMFFELRKHKYSEALCRYKL